MGTQNFVWMEEKIQSTAVGVWLGLLAAPAAHTASWGVTSTRPVLRPDPPKLPRVPQGCHCNTNITAKVTQLQLFLSQL